jgi:glutamyl/glutaminyl-tRNA synthetase
LLRIEDTDTKRNTPTATAQVISDLRWLGIDWDEGPEVGGPNGPYMQSERREIYEKYIRQLIEEGKAYYCFETTEELAAMREEASAQKKNLKYSRPEVFPTEKEMEKAKADGRGVTVRFAVPDEPIVVQDVVRGEVSFAAGEIGDFIIQKSDGFPTYNFACIVDDELMGVTHVCRGQEHLMNTPGQQALQDALGFRRPVYVHMSVTVSESGGKLSKRERPEALRKAIKSRDGIDVKKLADAGGISIEQVEMFLKGESSPDMPVVNAMAQSIGLHLPEINVVDFFNSGYLPETMVNFLALLGWNPGDGREIMTVEELIECFDFGRLTKTNSLFDRKKLLSFNTERIRMLGEEKLVERFREYLKAVKSPVLSADDVLFKRIIKSCEGARTLEDIERKSRFLFLEDEQIEYDEKAVKKVLLKGDSLTVLALVREKLASMEEFSGEGIEQMLRNLAEERGVGLGKVAQPLRVALCGTTVSLSIFGSVQMLGRERVLSRIDRTLKEFKTGNQA